MNLHLSSVIMTIKNLITVRGGLKFCFLHRDNIEINLQIDHFFDLKAILKFSNIFHNNKHHIALSDTFIAEERFFKTTSAS